MAKKNNKKNNKKSKPVAIEDLTLEGWEDLDCCSSEAMDNIATIDTLEVRLDLIQTLADLGAGLELYCNNGCSAECAKAGNLFEVIQRLAKG